MVSCAPAADYIGTVPYTPPAKAVQPAVFLGKQPGRPYREVGVVRVHGFDVDDIPAAIEAALEIGAQRGCNVLVALPYHAWGARDFACGVYIER